MRTCLGPSARRHGHVRPVALRMTSVRAVDNGTQEEPDDLIRFEAAYGEPSRSGFGSAVLHETLHGTDDLTQAAGPDSRSS